MTMCEKTMALRVFPRDDELNPLEYRDCDPDKYFPPFVTCHRCEGTMWRMPVIKRSGPRYQCPACGRLIKMDPKGRIEIIRTGEKVR